MKADYAKGCTTLKARLTSIIHALSVHAATHLHQHAYCDKVLEWHIHASLSTCLLWQSVGVAYACIFINMLTVTKCWSGIFMHLHQHAYCDKVLEWHMHASLSTCLLWQSVGVAYTCIFINLSYHVHACRAWLYICIKFQKLIRFSWIPFPLAGPFSAATFPHHLSRNCYFITEISDNKPLLSWVYVYTFRQAMYVYIYSACVVYWRVIPL